MCGYNPCVIHVREGKIDLSALKEIVGSPRLPPGRFNGKNLDDMLVFNGLAFQDFYSSLFFLAMQEHQPLTEKIFEQVSCSFGLRAEASLIVNLRAIIISFASVLLLPCHSAAITEDKRVMAYVLLGIGLSFHPQDALGDGRLRIWYLAFFPSPTAAR